MKCLICEKPTKAHNYFCSDECRAINDEQKKIIKQRKKDAKFVTKKCVFCNELFKTDHHQKKYCSDNCRIEDFRVSRLKKETTKKCILCGKEFSTSFSNKIFCTNACYIKSKCKGSIATPELIQLTREQKTRKWNIKLTKYWHEYGC